MIKKIYFIFPLVVLMAVGCNSTKTTSNNTSSNTFNNACGKLSQQEILSILPAGADKYVFGQTSTYSPDSCHYAFNLYFSNTMVPTPKNDQFVGAWVVDTANKTASRIAVPTIDYDYNFSKWISSSQLELASDNDDTTATYDINAKNVVVRKIDKLIFRFKINSDVTLETKALSPQADLGCTETQKTNNSFFFYPISCVQQSDVQLTVPNYKTFTLKYISPTSIEINGKPQTLSDSSYVEIDL